MYGFPDIGTDNPESRVISRAMMDYWISFVVSGTPNDGKGVSSTPFKLCSVVFARFC